MQVREDDANDLPRGTRITLHLKEDAAELADAAKLGSLIKQYSEFIQFPIRLWAAKTEYEQVTQGSSSRFCCSTKSLVQAAFAMVLRPGD